MNKTLFNEYYNIQFLKSYYYDYLTEEYKKALMEQKEAEEKKTEEGASYPIVGEIYIQPIAGGSALYYETFKALHETNQPLTLKYIYTCGFGPIYTNVSIDLWICNEIYEDKCINKKTCSEIESLSKENCEKLITSNEESKCIFDENNNKCLEKKICSLVVNEPETNCDQAVTLNIKTKCAYDEMQKKCIEKNKTCTEMFEGANNEICSSASTENSTCSYDKDLKKCIERQKCLSALNVKDEKDCFSLPTSDDARLKCTLKIEGDNKSCIEEEKINTQNNNYNETIVEDGDKYNNLSFILFLIYLIIFCC